MVPFLKSSGYNVKKDVQFLPISGLIGANLKSRMDKSICPWWDGPCLFEALDDAEVPPRDPNGSFRTPYLMYSFRGLSCGEYSPHRGTLNHVCSRDHTAQ